MAHNLHFNAATGKHSFVAVGEKAWHGLGTYVEQAMTAEQAIRLGGLDYSVDKRPIQVVGGRVVPNQFATVRTDTGDPLGIVTDQYQIIQNLEAFEFFDSIVDRGEAIYQTAGVLGRGERVFILAKLPTDILVHSEQVENYLLLTTGHDGRSATEVGFTSVRVVCQNTLQTALKGLQNKVTILHLKNARQKLHNASKVMGMASQYVEQLNPLFNRMAEARITDTELRHFLETVLKPQKETLPQQGYSTLFKNKVDSVMDFALHHPTQANGVARGTVWGAYNAVSGYYGYIKSYKSQEEKMKDLYFKGAAKRIEGAFDVALSLI
jgi:phage/plasmid-like protein (TIGR03299 family)